MKKVLDLITPKRSHKQNIRDHAIKRFKERLGITLSFDEYYKICEEAMYIVSVRSSHQDKIKRMKVRGYWCNVVFDTIHQMIITVHPNNIVNTNKAL
jgi:hypothetical protein